MNVVVVVVSSDPDPVLSVDAALLWLFYHHRFYHHQSKRTNKQLRWLFFSKVVPKIIWQYLDKEGRRRYRFDTHIGYYESIDISFLLTFYHLYSTV